MIIRWGLAINHMYNNLREFSPVDTGTYKKTHRIKFPVIWKNFLLFWIESVWDYVERIETWFRKTPVTWHMADGSTYNSIGAKPYERAKLKSLPYILNTLNKW